MEDEFGPDDLLSESDSTEVEKNFQENSVITSREENRIQQYLNQNTQGREEIAGNFECLPQSLAGGLCEDHSLVYRP